MTHKIIMPDLGQTTGEGKILKWLKRPGERVSRGDFLLEVETDKVTLEVESYASGYVRELLVKEGEKVCAAIPIAIITDEPDEPYGWPGETWSSSATVPAVTAAAGAAPEAQCEQADKDSAPYSPTPAASTSFPDTASEQPIRAAPAARTLARERGIDLGLVAGTGAEGLITRRDVERYANRRPMSPGAHRMAAMAALAGKSKQSIPHFYVTADVDVSAAERWREQWNENHPELRASSNDVFVRAASLALRDVPALNVAYGNGRYEPRQANDVLVVVALQPGGLALMPVADPGAQTWEQCLRSIRQALDSARHGRVTLVASRDTPLLAISSLGRFGVKQFAAIIPPSCAAVLAIGAIREAAVVHKGQLQVGKLCTLTLSADHRVVDGIAAATFLQRMQHHLNEL